MKQNYTHLILVLDASGSMGHLQDATIEGINSLVEKQKAEPGELSTALYTFNQGVKEVRKFETLNRTNYSPSGSTALLDAVCIAIHNEGETLAAKREEDRPDKVIVVVDTDGEENASSKYKLEDLQALVKVQKNQFNWQFVFLGANIDAFKEGSTYGFASHSTMQYDPTANGVFTKYATVMCSMTAYRSGITADVDLTNKTV
jgi:uncharacterized protein YegL